MRSKDVVGRFGEDLAVAHLQAAGLVVVARNWRCPDGEIDVVARDGRALVFCEVKTRSGLGMGEPAAAVVGRKARQVRRLALRYLETHRPAGCDEVRFDVVAVLRGPGGVRLEHLRGAF